MNKLTSLLAAGAFALAPMSAEADDQKSKEAAAAQGKIESNGVIPSQAVFEGAARAKFDLLFEQSVAARARMAKCVMKAPDLLECGTSHCAFAENVDDTISCVDPSGAVESFYAGSSDDGKMAVARYESPSLESGKDEVSGVIVSGLADEKGTRVTAFDDGKVDFACGVEREDNVKLAAKVQPVIKEILALGRNKLGLNKE